MTGDQAPPLPHWLRLRRQSGGGGGGGGGGSGCCGGSGGGGGRKRGGGGGGGVRRNNLLMVLFWFPFKFLLVTAAAINNNNFSVLHRVDKFVLCLLLMIFTARDMRKAASLFLPLVLLVLVYIHVTSKKKSILSLTLVPNLCERMEKK
jgi:hypothetical protein